MKAARLKNDNIFYKLMNDLLNGATPKIKAEALKELLNNPRFFNRTFTDDAKDAMKVHKGGESSSKNLKEIFFNFFGMNENWSLGRNILGGLMVHCPEWPTYFIPAYTQAKATGDASELKKGEGPRGLITGGLEGIAVGALVSGRILKPKEMVPYIILGAALQLFSSKLFPWLGEKIGRIEYDKMHPKPLGKKEANPVMPANFAAKPLQKPIANPPAFKSKSLYNTNHSNRMKV